MGLMASHACATPSSTVMPAAQLFAASSCDKRIGVGRPTTTRAMPDSMTASVHGAACRCGSMVRGLRRGSRLRARYFELGSWQAKRSPQLRASLRDNFAIAHEHGSYERIGVRESRAAARELNSSAHIFDIGFAVVTVASCLCLVSGRLQKEGGCGLRFPPCER